jgi:putative flavoprotein involved in K+ transport
MNTRVPILIIGGGQAGLALGFQLARRGLPFLILDAEARVGDSWRRRWDSLRLFTPARYVGLPGMRFPGRRDAFPTKEELADYLERYARRFELPVRSGVRVERLARQGDGFVAIAGAETFECEQVVIAMANYQRPYAPALARELDPAIVQVHSHEYRNPSQLRPGRVLVVGAGNSGADIAIEVAKTHETWMAGKESGHIPFRIESYLARNLMIRGVRFVGHHVLSVATPLGRKLRPELLLKASPLIRVKPWDLVEAGIVRTPRVTGARDGMPVLADDRTLQVENVIWCTGYEHGFPWVDLPIFGDHGEPRHEKGIVPDAPGLYFLGLHFLFSMTSATLVGVGRDAERLARVIAARARVSRAA